MTKDEMKVIIHNYWAEIDETIPQWTDMLCGYVDDVDENPNAEYDWRVVVDYSFFDFGMPTGFIWNVVGPYGDVWILPTDAIAAIHYTARRDNHPEYLVDKKTLE